MFASLTSVMSTPLANHSEVSCGKRLFEYPTEVNCLFVCLAVDNKNGGPKSGGVVIASGTTKFGLLPHICCDN